MCVSLTSDIPEGVNHGRIEAVDLNTEMQRSYMDYAMSVIVGRALPDVRDGLKPVHRRVLYAMFDGGYRPDRAFSKCSRVVGDVMGKYHPHGDSAIYDTMVRMVQPWSLRYPHDLGPGQLRLAGQRRRRRLAVHRVQDGPARHGDGPRHRQGHRRLGRTTTTAASRSRRSCRPASPTCWSTAPPASPWAWRPTSRRTTSPRWRPACSGTSTTPRPSREELLEALIERIPGPDFPTGAIILGRRGIDDAYRTGRGSDHDARGGEHRRGPGPHVPGHHAAAVPGEPRQPGDQDRGPRQGRQGRRHRGHPRPVLWPHRPAPRDRAQARRRGQGRAQQPLQAHAAAGDLRREHARDRRRRAAHPVARRLCPPLDHPPARGDPASDRVPPAGSRARSPHPAGLPEGARRARRGHRPDPPLARCRGSARSGS